MKENVESKPNGTTQIHNVRFYTIKPRGIVSLAYSKELNCLALSREDGSIELWNMHYAPFLDRVIQLTPETQVESLAWAGKRLFSVDLTGKLIEWDLNSLKPRYEHSPTGNALWCLDVNYDETQLAIGSEEGHINIMSIEQDELNYKTLFNKQNGRVLCCKFDKPGERLVTASIGAVRIWSVAQGNVLHTMTLLGSDVIVHALLVLGDNTIVAGDSLGNITVWDGSNATQLESSKMLDRNIFALAINEQENRLVCSGKQPPLIRVLTKTRIKREDAVYERWIKILQRDVHTHYVKCLIVVGNRIISGGEDGLLCISSIIRSREDIVKYAPFVQGPCAGVAPSAKLLLLRYPRSLHLWCLGSPRDNEKPSSIREKVEELQLEQPPEKLMQMNVSAEKFITAAAISSDNAWICYSTVNELRLSRLQLDPLGIERLTDNLPPELEPATFIFFPKVDKLYLFHAASCQLRCFELQRSQVVFLHSIDLSGEIDGPVSHMELSACGKHLAVATSNHLIAVWKLIEKRARHLLNLPRNKAGTTALAIRDNGSSLVAAYADGRLMEYDLHECRFINESTKRFVASAKDFCTRGILFHAENPNIIIAYNEIDLCILEGQRAESKSPNASSKKSKPLSEAVESPVSKVKGFSLITRLSRQHLVQVCPLSPKELVTIGIQTKNLLAALPPPFIRKKFGKS